MGPRKWLLTALWGMKNTWQFRVMLMTSRLGNIAAACPDMRHDASAHPAAFILLWISVWFWIHPSISWWFWFRLTVVLSFCHFVILFATNYTMYSKDFGLWTILFIEFTIFEQCILFYFNPLSTTLNLAAVLFCCLNKFYLRGFGHRFGSWNVNR